LEDICAALHTPHEVFEDLFLIQSEASYGPEDKERREVESVTSQVAHSRVQHEVGEKIRPSRDDNALQIPTRDLDSQGREVKRGQERSRERSGGTTPPPEA
jgi:hypothetical protein